MALVPCKECKKEVSVSAKTCPHCGVTNPGISTTKGCLVLILFSILIAFILSTCSGESSTATQAASLPNTEQAQKYVVLRTEEYVTPPDKKGLKFTIYSETADTFEKRGQTLIQAAQDLLNDQNLYEVIVKLSALPNTKPKYIHAGLASYNPHKKNTWGEEQEYIWDVTASPNKIVDGQLEEGGKFYPLDYMSTETYLKE